MTKVLSEKDLRKLVREWQYWRDRLDVNPTFPVRKQFERVEKELREVA